MPRLFALDHNSPQPIVAVLSEYQADAELVRVDPYLAGICQRTRSNEPQVWTLAAANRPHRPPWDYLKRFAEHNNRSSDDVWAEIKLSPEVLARDPLAGD
jgi:hypothetical protein